MCDLSKMLCGKQSGIDRMPQANTKVRVGPHPTLNWLVGEENRRDRCSPSYLAEMLRARCDAGRSSPKAHDPQALDLQLRHRTRPVKVSFARSENAMSRKPLLAACALTALIPIILKRG